MDNLTYKNITSDFKYKETKNDKGEEFINIEGLASTFGNMDRDGDIIMKGAFENTLANGDQKIKLLDHHNPTKPLGVIDKAIETDEGLFIMARMPKANSLVADMIPMLRMGAISDFSIGFNIVDSETTPDGNQLIKQIDLFEVSLVTFPANKKAKITSVKSVCDIEKIKTKRDFEQLMLDTECFSRKACTYLASKFSEDLQSDSEDLKKKEQRDSVLKDSILEELEKLKLVVKSQGN